MSNLSFTTGLCQGWSNPGTNYSVPTIAFLSGTYSPAGGTTLVAIFGTNFKLFSTIKFGTYTPTMIFINSGQIDFYVPSSALPGNNPVQVFNDTYGSNTVEYTLEQAQGFWFLDPTYSNVITNSNVGGLSIDGPTVINNDLTVSGNIYGNVIPPSDYRIKDIIEPLNASYSVDNLKPIKYFNKKSEREEIGFLAHEVQQSFPCLVTGEKDGPDIQTLNYVGLIGVLVQEIQQLKADIKQLKEKHD